MGRLITKFHHKGTARPPAKGELYAKNFSNGEVLRRAKSDPEAQPLTAEQLVKFRRVDPFAKKK